MSTASGHSRIPGPTNWVTALLNGGLIPGVWDALRKGSEPPEVTPQRFVTEGLRRAGSTVVACVGASITHGRIGASFVDVLSERLGRDGFQFVNAGVNGDLAFNTLQRLNHVIACDPDVAIVLVGSNDVMAGLGMRRALGYRVFKRLPVHPTLPWYRDSLRALATRLTRETRARVVLCSLPTLGERVDAQVNQRLAAYNAVIGDIAAETDAAYLPLHEHLDAWLARVGHANGPAFASATRLMLSALVRHYRLGHAWDEIASAHGYELFVDGMHVSDRGAHLIADQMERFLREERTK